MRKAKIKSLGGFLPPSKLTNHDLEKMVNTSDEWIVERTGIKERRIAKDNAASSDMAKEAALLCLENGETDPLDLDLVIVATMSPDYVFPATACVVQEAIGAKNAAAMDLEVGCTGFVYALVTAAQFVSAGAYENVLVVGADTMSRLVDWEDRATCCLFGDGAGAALVVPSSGDEGILGFSLGSKGEGANLLMVEAGGTKMPASHETVSKKQHFLRMEGRRVFKFAVTIMEESLRDVMSKCNISIEQLDIVVPHQANSRILESASQRMGLPMEKMYINLDKYGNTSSASVPIALWEAVEKGLVKKGDIVALVAFGAGLTWGSCIIRW